MPFIDMGNEFGDTKEAELAPQGRKYDLLCHDIEELEKEGKRSLRVTMRIEGEDQDYAPFSHFLSLPNPELDQRNDEDKGHSPGTTTNTKMLMIKRFLHAFDVPFTTQGFDPQDIPGSRSRLELTQEVYNDRRNQRISLPSLPEEGAERVAKETAKPAASKKKTARG